MELRGNGPDAFGQSQHRVDAGGAEDFSQPADFFDLGDGLPAQKPGRQPSASAASSGAARPKASGLKAASASGRPSVAAAKRATAKTPQAKDVARSPRRWPRIVAAVLGACVLAAAVLGGLWAWDRWLRYDDASDIQGQWRTADGTALVVIDAAEIRMPDSVEFSYMLDTQAKTITYAFTGLSGGGSYEFSDDRSTLSITESDGSTVTLSKVSGDTSAEPALLDSAMAGADASAEGEGAVEGGETGSSDEAASTGEDVAA